MSIGLIPISQSLKKVYRGLNKVECYTLMVSISLLFLKVASLKWSIVGTVGRIYNPKDRGEGEKHSVAWVHCIGQHVIMSSRRPLPTLTLLEKKLETDERGQERGRR